MAVLSELNKSRVSYAVTGAAAASYYGNPRTTTDVDFIVRIVPQNLSRLLRATENAGLKVDPARIRRQLETGYNVIRLRDKKSAYAVDFIVQQGPIQKRKGSMLGIPAYYQAPESLILAKLRMIRATMPPERSLKDRSDIVSILANTRVDKHKVERSARRESTLEIFNEINKRSPNR